MTDHTNDGRPNLAEQLSLLALPTAIVTRRAERAAEQHLGAQDALALHRHHMAPTQGNSVDLLQHRIRIEGGDFETKKRIAYRIALCWNLCEGWPTTALEDGVLQEVSLAVDNLVTELQDEKLSAAAVSALRRLEHAIEQQDCRLDRRDGRLHDWADCLQQTEAENE